MAHKDNDTSNLIPDYCNDRLNANDKANFARLLKEDQQLLAEYNDFKRFQKLYRQIEPDEPSPSDAIFDQISRQVSTQQKGKNEAPAQSRPFAESMRYFWQQMRESVTVPWVLAAAQAVVIVLLLLPATQQNTYSTLSASAVSANAQTVDINVVFRPNSMESDIRSLLHTIKGSVSSGPSIEGRYVISISQQSNLDKVVRTLKQSEIVLFAESVY